jgi:hypothetical protein
MVAFLTSLVVTILLTVGVVAYGRRRPIGTPLTWGEAMFGAAVVFMILFLIYGVVPHQWLQWADSELGWRKDKILAGPEVVTNKTISLDIPMTITYETVRDAIAAGIYIVALGVQMYLWSKWQKRGQAKPKEIPTSAFGRPLVKAES